MSDDDVNDMLIGELRAALIASRAREAKLVEALRGLNAHVEKMQDRVVAFLMPDGPAGQTFINEMIYALDGPEQRAAQGSARSALSLYDTPAEMPGDVHPQEG